MESAAVSYLNQHTRAVLDLVRKGHTVEVTDRGRPIARIVPIRPAVTGIAAQLVAAGRARAPAQAGRALSWTEDEVDAQRRASRSLADLRGEERY